MENISFDERLINDESRLDKMLETIEKLSVLMLRHNLERIEIDGLVLVAKNRGG